MDFRAADDTGEHEERGAPRHAISFGEAARFWLKLGFISFGGSTGQIAIMHSELVERRRWISEKRFLHALNYCMLLPGPEAQQLATYIGWLMHRTLGGLIAGGLFVLPSLFIMIALSWIYVRFGSLPVVAGIFFGLKPAVTALVLYAGFKISVRALRNAWLWSIAAVAFVAIFALDVPYPAIVLGAAIVGWFGAKRWPGVFVLGAAHAEQQTYGRAIIDDDTPPPPHVQFTKRHTLRVVLIGAALWAGAFAAVVAAFGAGSTLTAMSGFFTKAALVTFGGAYAVLPYVYQGAVETHQWLSGPQMIDGLALGETTPGPLIMVVAFVGFLGGWSHEVLGSGALLLGGVLGATVATFFTFLPSFVFIFAGGPLVEATHGDLRYTAPLSAITAAVVGVIVNLAVFFAWYVFWPQGLPGGVDWPAVTIALGAGFALWRLRVAVLPLLAACAAAGLAVTLLRSAG